MTTSEPHWCAACAVQPHRALAAQLDLTPGRATFLREALMFAGLTLAERADWDEVEARTAAYLSSVGSAA